MFEKGDIVSRNSYGNDLYFKVEGRNENGELRLFCVNCRLEAGAPEKDCSHVKKKSIFQFLGLFKTGIDKKVDIIWRKRGKQQETMCPGKVLHIDSDADYLQLCKKYYDALAIPAEGHVVPEEAQADKVKKFIETASPDILILTGHDSLKKSADKEILDNYKTSACFMKAVKEARKCRPSRDSLVIFAGACQSCYEEILRSGANYASSPERVFIHALDPVFVAEKIAYTSMKEILSLENVIENTAAGISGIGGVETRGLMRAQSPW